MNARTVLATESLSVGYDGYAVLSQIDVAIAPGTLTVLIGANGSGKSTLLRTLSGVQKPVGGKIDIEGRDIVALSRTERARTLSMVFTDRTGGGGLTVSETVGIGRHPYTGMLGHLGNRDKEIIAAAIADVGMGAFVDRRLGSLSDGERQKVMIAKSLAQETPIVFLDEPTAFLDYPSKVEIMQLLLRLAREKNKTVFLSTHDLELALQIADKIWLVDKEHGLRIGTPEDLSLDGEMGRFFEREGVVFDLESGLFRIDNKTFGEIRLTGDGPRAAMAAKALRRLGVEAKPVSDSPHSIIVKDENFDIDGLTVSSIAELIDTVRNIPGIGDK